MQNTPLVSGIANVRSRFCISRIFLMQAGGATLEALIYSYCRPAKFLSLVGAERFLLSVGWRHAVPTNPVVTRAADNSRTNRIIGLICPLFAPSRFY